MNPAPRLPLSPRLVAAAGLAMLAVALLYGMLAWRGVRDEQITRMQTVLEIAQKATNSYFVELEAALEHLVEDLQADGALADAARSGRMVQRFRELHPTFTAVNLLAPDGTIVAAALSPDRSTLPRIQRVQGPSWQDFLARLGPDTTLDLGRPLRATVAPGWFFPMRYVLRDTQGRPVAFLSATLSVDVLQRFWSDAPVVAQSSIGMIRDDDYLISLYPAAPQATQDMIYGSPRSGVVPRGGEGQARHGYVEGNETILGQAAGFAYQRLADYPVTIFVATPLASYRAAWWEAVRLPFALMALFGLAGMVALHVLGSRQRALRAERQLTEAALAEKRIAERANRAKTEFMARISHELRTPLNAILGFTQLLQRDTPGTLVPEQQRELQHVVHAGHHLLSLIDDLLDLSRVEAGTLRLQLADVDAADVVRDAMGQIAVEAEARGVGIALDVPPGALPPVLADRTRLRQIVLNLLSNAVKYNRPGGSVSLRLRAEGAHLRLAVRDTGPGLAPAQVEQLFQPFNRLGREAGSIPGTGIGLVITRSLVELMDGQLEVFSEPGVGSEFGIRLPLSPAAPPEQDPHAGADSNALPPGTGAVLYIDDDEVNRVLMQAYLAVRPGVSLRVAASGPEGLAMARAARPDLLLVDMMMPGMNGLQVLAAARADPALRTMPCVAISANAMPEEIDAATRAGFDGYLVKPLAVDVLLREIDRRLAPRAEAPATPA
ncbi:MAG TPA: ATP-binding protein [Methylibium sp.]|nr:ATP-binding protein [Methylibium sp.]